MWRPSGVTAHAFTESECPFAESSGRELMAAESSRSLIVSVVEAPVATFLKFNIFLKKKDIGGKS